VNVQINHEEMGLQRSYAEKKKKENNVEQVYSILALLTLCAKLIFVVGDCSLHYKMFRNISIYCSIDAKSLPLFRSMTIQNVSRFVKYTGSWSQGGGGGTIWD
jgi:hypothetical protein